MEANIYETIKEAFVYAYFTHTYESGATCQNVPMLLFRGKTTEQLVYTEDQFEAYILGCLNALTESFTPKQEELDEMKKTLIDAKVVIVKK